jgi:ABC-2 type transport system permease protein
MSPRETLAKHRGRRTHEEEVLPQPRTAIRHSAWAIATLFGMLFVLPGIMAALPQEWQNTISRYLPGNAGQQIFAVHIKQYTLQPWAGLGIFCIYAAIALAAGAVLLTRRDA